MLPSIEQIAAFLDGNLSEKDMQQFSLLAEHDSTLRQLLDASSEVDEAMTNFTDVDLQLPTDIAGSSFELPELDNYEDFSFDDSFTKKDCLYQQYGKHVEDYSKHGKLRSSLVDEIMDELDNEILDEGEMSESDIEPNLNIDDNNFDNDLSDIYI